MEPSHCFFPTVASANVVRDFVRLQPQLKEEGRRLALGCHQVGGVHSVGRSNQELGHLLQEADTDAPPLGDDAHVGAKPRMVLNQGLLGHGVDDPVVSAQLIRGDPALPQLLLCGVGLDLVKRSHLGLSGP